MSTPSEKSDAAVKEPVAVLVNELDAGEHAAEVEGALQDETLFTAEQNKKLLRKIDLIIMPVMMFSYGLQYVDKVSLASGAVFGLITETNLVGQQFAWLTTIFYLGDLVFQFPVAWLMQRYPLGRTLSVLVILWGAMVMCLAACQNFTQLMVVRFILGAFESAITPGFAMMVGSWYRTEEQVQRQMSYYIMNGFFSLWTVAAIYYLGLRAETSGGLAGWRVINLFLGGMTVATGIVSVIVFGQPSEVFWLSPVEKRAAHARIISNGAGKGEREAWKWDQVLDGIKDPQTWFLITLSCLICIPNGGLTTFVGLIFVGLGFSSSDAVLYQLPLNASSVTYFFVCIVCITKWPKTRMFFMSFSFLPPFAALLSIGLLPNDAFLQWTKYGLYCLIPFFAVPIFIQWSLMPANIAGRTKRSFVTGCALVSYCVGNCVGAQVFQSSDAPRYTKGLTATAFFFAVMFFLVLGQWWYVVRENARRDALMVKMSISPEERALRNKIEGELDRTDRENIYFRYTI